MKILYSLRFQFIALFSIFIIAFSFTTAILGLRQLPIATGEIFATQGIFLVEKASSLIDGDSFEALTKSMDNEDPFYEEARQKLLDLKLSSSCMYLYTMAPYKDDIWYFIIDGSTEPGDEIFSELGDEEDTSDYDSAFKKVLSSHKIEVGELVYQEGWGWLVSVYAPIENSSGKVVGIIGCDFDGTHLRDTIIAGRTQTIIIGILSMLIGIALMTFFLRTIFMPLRKIKTILQEISIGEGDLTKRLIIDKKNEIGELASLFNMTLDKIKKLIVVIMNEISRLHNIGNDLASNMQQTAGAVNNMNSNIYTIKQKVISQSKSVSETHSNMEQVTNNIDKLEKNVEAQTSSVSRSSSAIEELLTNIQSVTKTLIQNAENVKELISVSGEGRNSLHKVTQDIREIAKESEGLFEINSVMENISSQTNLLSMNAAIEAAHAGETGKGFAVVAAEIRKLANNSSDQSKTISNVLNKIKTAIDTITVSTNTVLERFQAIDERIRIVSAQEENIRNAMEEQGRGSQKILEAVSVLNEQTQMVKKNSIIMIESSNEVIKESKHLEKATAEISGSMNDVASGAEQINSSVSYVNGLSKDTKELIEILSAEISRFKVDK